jgi:hypothetical protein
MAFVVWALRWGMPAEMVLLANARTGRAILPTTVPCSWIFVPLSTRGSHDLRVNLNFIGMEGGGIYVATFLKAPP